MSAAAIAFVVCVAVCAVAHVAILRSVVRARAGIVAASADSTVPKPNLIVEVVWALVPAIALALVLTATWARIQQRGASPAVIMRVAQ